MSVKWLSQQKISNNKFKSELATVTGGTLTSDSIYYYRTFTSNGNLVISNANLICDILVIAGGGSGNIGKSGTYFGSGGGAGEVKSLAFQLLPISTYAIVIGAGGAPVSNGILNVDGNSGTSSSFSSIITSSIPGGGGLYNTGFGGTSGNGFLGGGPGTSAPNTGGGAGSGATGNNASSNSGSGGTGVNTITGIGDFSSWITTTGIGVSGYIAGGGGGSSAFVASGGAGGAGGGGAGAGSSSNAGDGTINTGSGSGGGLYNSCNSGTGGSGVVVVRYLKSAVL